MTEQNKFRESIGLGTTKKNFRNDLFKSGLTGIMTGVKQQITLLMRTTKKQAEDGLKTGQSKEDIQKTKDNSPQIYLNTKLIPKLPKITTRSDLKMENTYSKIDKLIEEYSKNSIGSSPTTERIINVDRIGHRVEEKKMIDDMQKIIDLKNKHQLNATKEASKIEPGTEMTARENTIGITQQATNTNAEARWQGAQNHAEHLELLKKAAGIVDDAAGGG